MRQITDLYISDDGEIQGTLEEVKEYEEFVNEKGKNNKGEKDKDIKNIVKEVEKLTKLIEKYANAYDSIPFVITDLRPDRNEGKGFDLL